MIGAEPHAVFAQDARDGWSRSFISAAIRLRSSTPSASISWNAMPRAMPVMSSAFESSNSGPSSFSICVFSQSSSRVSHRFARRRRSGVRRR